MHHGRLALTLCASFILLVGARPSPAEDAGQFYTGKTIRVLVGYPPGSRYDNYARIAVRHMGRHLPGNPTMIVHNMPGAGGLKATANLAAVAAPDGLTLALINPMNTMEPLLNPEAAKFDPLKFKWIGSINSEVGTCAFWRGDVKTLDDLKRQRVTLGATGPSAGSVLDAKVLQGIFGLNLKIVSGYPGLTDVRLAAESKEVDGFCGLQVSSIKTNIWDQYKAGQFNVVLQTGIEKHPDLSPSVPSVFELAPDEDSKKIMKLIFSSWAYGAPIVAPPNTPDDRMTLLRQAFDAMVEDSQFKEEAKKMALEVQPMEAGRIATLVAEAYTTPKDIVARARALLAAESK